MPKAAKSLVETSARTARPRRIILCLDGTWNSAYNKERRPDGHTVLKPTNVLKVARGVQAQTATDGRDQLVYYDTGVGSLARYPGRANKILHWTDRLAGGVWGAGFEVNIEDAILYLALNHERGDEIFVFGFSRGAATAQGLTKFLAWTKGLPKKSDAYYLPILFREFVDSGAATTFEDALAKLNEQRQKTDNRPPLEPFLPVNVKFLGVWDTVMALGSRFRTPSDRTSEAGRTFYVDQKPAGCVEHARQALAVDEQRYDFRPEVWTGAWPGQTMKQRWFAGVHANVGGGYPDDGLANTALHWILKEAEALGLETNRPFINHYRAHYFDVLYDSYSGWFRFFDWVRLKPKGSPRELRSRPASANLGVDPSVIHRIRWDPRPGQNGTSATGTAQQAPPKYRPENVLRFLAVQPDLDVYLESLGLDGEARQLPSDVMERITQLRKETST